MDRSMKLAEILLVEDNEGDIELTKEAFEEAKFRNNLVVARDGDEALDYLFKRHEYENAITPDLILLDLNIPRTSGTEILAAIKEDNDLRLIPTIILSSSSASKDIIKSYQLHANCFITKPVDAFKFIEIIQQIEDFWIEIVHLPSKNRTT